MGIFIGICILFILFLAFGGKKSKQQTPAIIRNQAEREIVIARPKPEKRNAKIDALPDDLEISEEFQKAFDLMNDSSESVFITGKAGTGKSTLLKYFRLKTRKKIVVLAPTGIAALQVNGQTVHSFFRFPPKLIEPKTIYANEERSSLFKNIDTIIIDEISMVRADLIEGIDRSLKVHRGNQLPFGGVQMVFFGDLFQLPPVVGKDLATYFQQVYKSPFFFSAKSMAALPLHKIELQKIYRQKGDQQFINLLNRVRKNQLAEDTLEELNERVVPNFQAQRDDNFLTLCTTNKVADGENERRLEGLKGNTFQYDANVSPTFDPKLFPTQQQLRLKVGSQVMLLKNDTGKGYVNGSIGKVKSLAEDEIMVEVNGRTVTLEKADWEQIEYRYDAEKKKIEAIVVGTFIQYPLKLAWAITIHKSQGQTFQQVVVDLGTGAFAHGQSYVALSRCTSLDGIVLKQNIRWQDVIVDHRIVEFMEEA